MKSIQYILKWLLLGRIPSCKSKIMTALVKLSHPCGFGKWMLIDNKDDILKHKLQKSVFSGVTDYLFIGC